MSKVAVTSVSQPQASAELLVADALCPAQSQVMSYPKAHGAAAFIMTHFLRGF